MTQTIELPLSEELLRRLDDRARSAGIGRDSFIQAVLAKSIGEPTIDEILAPFREQVTSSGIRDEELDRLFSEARELPKPQ